MCEEIGEYHLLNLSATGFEWVVGLVFCVLVVLLVNLIIPRKREIFETKFYARPTVLNTQIIEQLQKVKYVVPYLYNKHIGTCAKLGLDTVVEYDRVILKHSCGSQFAADWFPRAPTFTYATNPDTHPASDSTASTNQPMEEGDVDGDIGTEWERAGVCPRGICIFIPGLSSVSDDKYVKQFVKHMHLNDYSTVVVAARGVGVPLTTSRVWHPALTCDVLMVLHQIPEGCPIYFAAFSAGTNILRKVLYHLHDHDLFWFSAPKRSDVVAIPQVLRSGKKVGVGIRSASTKRRDVNKTAITSNMSPTEKKRFNVVGAISICVAGRDYCSARSYLEQHTPDRGTSNLNAVEVQPRHFMHQAQLGVMWESLWNLEGLFYSMMMAKLFKDILHQNKHIHDDLDTQLLKEVNGSVFMSDIDRSNWKLFDFESEEHMVKEFSINESDIRNKIDVPLLLVQPSDDPLHKSNPSYNIDWEFYTANPNIIYVQTSHGNHFGFYEDNLHPTQPTSLLVAIMNIGQLLYEHPHSYSYPPRLACTFFEMLRKT